MFTLLRKVIFYSAISDDSGGVTPNTQLKEKSTNEKLVNTIEELKKLNSELREARRAAFNLLEDAVQSKEALRVSELKYRTKLENEVQERTAELKENKELLSATINSSPDSIQVYKAIRSSKNEILNFQLLLLNNTAERKFGYQIGRLLNNPLTSEIEKELYNTFIEVLKSGLPYQFEKFVSDQNLWLSQTVVKLNDGIVITTKDITEEKNAEVQILQLKDEIARKATDKYYSLFNSVEEGFCIIEIIYDDKGNVNNYRFEEVNNAFLQHTGLENVVGKTALDLIPGTEPFRMTEVETVARTGQPLRFENYLEHTNKWHLAYATRVGESGKQFAILFNDITEHKLREQRHEFILNLSDEIRRLIDPVEIREIAAQMSGEYLKVNQAHYAEISGEYVEVENGYGDGVEPMKGKFLTASFGELLVEECKKGKILVCNNIEYESRINDKEREVLKALHIGAFIVVPLVREKEWVAVMAVHNIEPRDWKQHEIDLIADVAERTWTAVERAQAEVALKSSEERINKLISLMPAGVFSCDAEGRITYFNLRAAELWGREPIIGDEHEKYCGSFRMWTSEGKLILHDECPMADALKYGKSSRNLEVVFEQPTGKLVVVNVNIDPLYDRNHKLTGAINVFVDVTEKKLAETALLKSEDKLKKFNQILEKQVKDRTIQLKRSNEDLLQFAHVASHDLKEPIRKIKTYNNRLLNEFGEGLDKKARSYVKKVAESADRMISMIEGVLSYSKLEQTDLQMEMIDLSLIISQVKTDLEILIRQRNAVINETSLPVVSGAYFLIHQLFYNLILNSLKFARKDIPLQIDINVDTVEKSDGNYHRIILSDNGIGFEEEFSEIIFKTFTRLNPQEEYEGSGLGLALCKKIVERHHGTISAIGNPGKGAKFIILLPVT